MSSTPKKYLSLEEAAGMLSVSNDQLIRMRESGEIRGFADRGTWKFRVEDVEQLARTRQADSSPEVQLFNDSGPMVVGDEPSEAGSSTILADDAEADGDVGEQPTVIRKGAEAQKASDSDVKLIGEDSDSDITLAAPKPKTGSDSDVRLMGPDSDSDITLAPAGQGSDSDVKLIDASTAEGGSDSDVALIGGSDSSVALDLSPDDSEQASVLADDGGGLSMESSLTLAADSGISLEADEGITLASESGISLEGIADSGISLEDSDEFKGTMPMMDAVPDADGGEETKFEIPSMGDDSAFDLQMPGSKADDTGVLKLEDSGETTLDDAVFDLDEETPSGELDELEVASEILGEDDELEELDVFDADEGIFEESGASQEFAAPIVGRGVAMETEWSAPLVVGLGFSTVVMVVAMLVSFDLVRSMWQWSNPGPVSAGLLSVFGGGG
jgi:excisionase family DNA binding protein